MRAQALLFTCLLAAGSMTVFTPRVSAQVVVSDPGATATAIANHIEQALILREQIYELQRSGRLMEQSLRQLTATGSLPDMIDVAYNMDQFIDGVFDIAERGSALDDEFINIFPEYAYADERPRWASWAEHTHTMLQDAAHIQEATQSNRMNRYQRDALHRDLTNSSGELEALQATGRVMLAISQSIEDLELISATQARTQDAYIASYNLEQTRQREEEEYAADYVEEHMQMGYLPDEEEEPREHFDSFIEYQEWAIEQQEQGGY